jgi:hypothetical protein
MVGAKPCRPDRLTTPNAVRLCVSSERLDALRSQEIPTGHAALRSVTIFGGNSLRRFPHHSAQR